MVKRGREPEAELIADREKLEAAKAALARAETELKLLTGRRRRPRRAPPTRATTGRRAGLEWLAQARRRPKTPKHAPTWRTRLFSKRTNRPR